MSVTEVTRLSRFNRDTEHKAKLSRYVSIFLVSISSQAQICDDMGRFAVPRYSEKSPRYSALFRVIACFAIPILLRYASLPWSVPLNSKPFCYVLLCCVSVACSALATDCFARTA